MIRIVHSLGGCGGTLLSRCLGVLPGVALLSEVNPLAVHLFPTFEPLYQDRHWLHLLSREDIERFSAVDVGEPENFRDLMSAFYARSKSAGRTLILRDYNYVEFVGIPFNDQPPKRRIIYDALPRGVLTRGIAFVRHPVDQWLSLCKHGGLSSLLKPAYFCNAYAAFLEDLGKTPIFRYEDFVCDPETELRRICAELEIPFDPDFRSRFHTFSLVTGDFSRQADITISMPHGAPPPDESMQEFQSSSSFRLIVTSLGYVADQRGRVF